MNKNSLVWQNLYLYTHASGHVNFWDFKLVYLVNNTDLVNCSYDSNGNGDKRQIWKHQFWYFKSEIIRILVIWEFFLFFTPFQPRFAFFPGLLPMPFQNIFQLTLSPIFHSFYSFGRNKKWVLNLWNIFEPIWLQSKTWRLIQMELWWSVYQRTNMAKFLMWSILTWSIF